LKAFIDTNILIDVAARADQFPDSLKLINDIIEWDEASLWVSAISLNNLEYILSRMGHQEKARDFLHFIREAFSIIPFRRSVFSSALKSNNPDFEDDIQIACAEELGVDYIITRNTKDFIQSKIPALSPTEFLEKWNAGEFDTVTQVPFMDLKAQHHQIYNEVDDRITDIIGNTGFILGKHVAEFEERFAKAQGAKYCVGVSSGTDALHVALLALGIGSGDRVIVPVNTFIATAEAVSLTGAEPVFVDCDEYFNIDADRIREILRNAKDEISHRHTQTDTDTQTSSPADAAEEEHVIASRENIGRIRAVIPVHLYGQPANMDEIVALADEYGLKVVEDCCQAHLAEYGGRKVGNFGAFGCFSFYPGKNLGAYGEAGALITNDEGLFKRAKMFRQHGELERYHHQVVGHNYRMAAFQGAVLSTKLGFLKDWTEKRRENARLYSELLGGIDGIETPSELEGSECVYHLYVIQCDDRDGLQKYLGDHDVASGLHYPVPLHLQEAYGFLGGKVGDFPCAETGAKRILSLPMYPELTTEQIVYVCDRIKEYISKN